MLDRSQQLLDPSIYNFYIYIYIYICSARNQIHFFTFLSIESFLSSSKHLSFTLITLPNCISAWILHFFSGKCPKSLFSLAFHALDLGFGVFSKTFRVFEIFCESFGLGVVYLMLYDHLLHSISIFTMFHAFRCVFDCWKLCDARFGLGWTHDAIIFSTSHVHAYFMHTYPFFSIFLLWVVMVCFVCLSVSLSLSLG